MTDKQPSIQDELKKLEEIAHWFEESDDFDVEEGLKKVKEGAELVKKLKGRIKDVENEFKEVEADLTDDK
jgi:exodeoxyribonuclease VII small subunit